MPCPDSLEGTGELAITFGHEVDVGELFPSREARSRKDNLARTRKEKKYGTPRKNELIKSGDEVQQINSAEWRKKPSNRSGRERPDRRRAASKARW